MKKGHGKLRLHCLILTGLTAFLFFSVIINPLNSYAQKSLLDSTSVKINGEEWTFRTPPPPISQRKVISSHPRLFITQASLPALREKLSDSVYSNDMSKLRSYANNGNGISNALLYLLEGDINKGNIAKNYLLSGTYVRPKGLDTAGKFVEPILIFDWIMPLLSKTEKTQIFEFLKANFKYNHRTDTPHRRGETMFWNDVYSRQPELHYPILALAIAGDGIDDIWAQEVLDLAYNESPLVLGPYGSLKGGFLDMLAAVSLDDGGGTQAGSAGQLGGNYYAFFLHAFLPMGAWETATGQVMWARSPFFQKLPFYWAYEKSKLPSSLGKTMLEAITGIYQNIDPDAAALARWQVNKWGRSPYTLLYRLVLGDLRVTPKSPEELGLPTAKYIRGADLFVSSRSWDENAVTLTAISRYFDTSRYEPASGTFAIHRGLEPLAVPAEPKKIKKTAGLYSGLWFYSPNDVLSTAFQHNTYWSNNRVYNAYDAASEPNAFPGGPDNLVLNNTYRGMSTEYSKLLNAPGVRVARQTIVHILDTNRDIIVVYNYTDVPPEIKRAWSMRLAVQPNLQENGFSIPGMTTTVVAPINNTMTWIGGLENEMRSPPPEKLWYTGTKAGNTPGYSSDSNKAKRWGIGNLFIQPTPNASEKLEFLVVMQVSDEAPIAVSRISDREASFGGWKVSFSSNGSFNVIPPNGTEVDSTPPAAPKNLIIQ